MSERTEPPAEKSRKASPAGRPVPLSMLAAVIFAEGAIMATLTGLLFYELFSTVPSSYVSAIAVLVLSGLATVWLGVLAAHTLRGRPWIRGAALFWQLLQIAIGWAGLQGALARVDIGWLLILPAVLSCILLFTPSVLRATTRTDVSR
ncbi:MAG: hypothetical protein ACYCZK_00390 [Microbacteriaceae bacterium]